MGLIGILNRLNQVEEIIDRVTPKVSVDTFMSSVSDTLDKIIINEKSNNLKFIGGKTYFSLNEDASKILMHVEMFFSKSGGGFVKKETDGTYPVSMLNQSAHETFVSRLMSDGEYTIEVKEP